MEHGSIEKECFDFVRKQVIPKNRFCYVCAVEDEELVENAFNTAIPNPVWNKFPDFMFNGGFIEHFEVTSSHSNRNGSMMKIEKAELEKEADKNDKALEEEMNITPCYEGKTIITEKNHSKHTYDNFCFSFKRNWEKHIKRLEKYSGDIDTGVFMIQYNDSALVLDNVYPDIKLGLYYGDLLEYDEYTGYRLTHDSNMLEYIYGFKEQIKFVVFFNNDSYHGKKCEIICVENIPEILKIIKGRYRFHAGTITSVRYTYGISHKNPFYKGNEDNE